MLSQQLLKQIILEQALNEKQTQASVSREVLEHLLPYRTVPQVIIHR